VSSFELEQLSLGGRFLEQLESSPKRPPKTVLEQETARWSAKSHEQLLSELREGQAYEVALNSKRYTVGVELLESTPTYLNVAVAVDDGSMPASIRPLSRTFLRRKDDSGASA
jgi:hypothetical protein